MEKDYPIYNPTQGLSELISQKMRKLDTVDKTKYAGYYKQLCAEIRELEYLNEGLSSLKDFDILVEIQKAIDNYQSLDCSILNIYIPLDNRFNRTKIALLNFIEGRQND